MDIRNLFAKRLFDKFSDSDFVGVEIELPILNNNEGHIIDKKIIKELFHRLKELGFSYYSYSSDGDVIALKNNSNGDTISLEYSYNTLEISLGKSLYIRDLEKRFLEYYRYINNYLKEFNYELVGIGVNPYYHDINKTSINEKRYKVIEYLLSNKDNKLFGEFCSYIASVQTHVNINKEDIVKTLNMFTDIEDIKEELFTNSYIEELGNVNARKYLWENSNFLNNAGRNRKYKDLDDLLDDYFERKMFYIARDNRFYLVDNCLSIKEFFSKDRVLVRDINGAKREIKPLKRDIEDFRSYKSVELSKYGTLEIRTDCTQKIDKIFSIVAFNVGITKNRNKVIEYIRNNKILTKEKLLDLAIEGLKIRGLEEEKYLEV